MSSWTPKQALSKLKQIFQTSGSGESSSSSSADDDEIIEDEDIAVSPLAMMNEGSPEAWLGNFLMILGVSVSPGYSTIKSSQHDEVLLSKLNSKADAAAADNPLQLLDPTQADALKQQNWSQWWKLQGELGNYCYAVLSLSLLGDKAHSVDLATMYRQDTNSRIQKDAHYVLCYLLGKQWPGYKVTESDLQRLQVEG